MGLQPVSPLKLGGLCGHTLRVGVMGGLLLERLTLPSLSVFGFLRIRHFYNLPLRLVRHSPHPPFSVCAPGLAPGPKEAKPLFVS